jgi:hypothetical protein
MRLANLKCPMVWVPRCHLPELEKHESLTRPCRRISPHHPPPRHCIPTLPALEYLQLWRSPTSSLVFSPNTENARNSCSVSATKGGGEMRAPIYGVLILDPSLLSPLKLVKRWGCRLRFLGALLSMQSGRNLESYPRRGSTNGFAVSQPARTRTEIFVHTRTQTGKVGA